MNRVGNWLLSRPALVRSLMLGLVLAAVMVLPVSVEAQSSGCVAVTYGCPTSGPELESTLTDDQEFAIGMASWWTFVILVLIFTGIPL